MSAALLGLAACSSSSTPEASASEQVEGEDILSTVEVTQGPNSTLSAVVEAETTGEAVVSVSVSFDEDGPVGDPPPTDAGTSHSMPVVGMRAETTYTLEVTAEGSEGSETVEVDWTTGALPEGFPELSVDEIDSDAMASGLTLFETMNWDSPDEDDGEADDGEDGEGDDGDGEDGDGEADDGEDGEGDDGEDIGYQKYLVALDSEGEVVWYYEDGATLMPVVQTAEGTILVGTNDTGIREIDVLGNTLREFATEVAYDVGTNLSGEELTTEDSEPIENDSAHHELVELDNGNIVTLSTELVELDEADAEELCPDEPETDIVSDTVVELSPEGEVVQEWPLTDVYDPVERPGNEMCVEQMAIAPPSWFYPAAEGTRDWTHGNAVVVDEENNRLLVSLRHLDAIVALRYQDDDEGEAGELLWELGPEGDLELTGEGEWSYHQHDPDLEDDGTIILYDNGNKRPGAAAGEEGDEPPYSRAVQYEVDEEAGTVTQLWAHRDETEDGPPEYTEFLGGVDRLENDNVLITHGGGRAEDETLYGRLVEVVPGGEVDGSDDEVVFDMTATSEAGAGWTIYRANRVESIYGPGPGGS